MKNQGDIVQNFSELENEVSVSSGNVHNNVPVPPEYPDALFTYIETLIKEQRFEEAQKVHRQFLNFVKRALHSYVNRMMHLSHHYKNRAELPSEVIAYLDQNLILWFRDILNLLREETLHVLLHSAELSALAGKKEETDEFLLQFFFTADLRCGLTEKTQSDITEVLAIGEQDIEVRLNALTSKLSAEAAQKADSIAADIRSHMTDIISQHFENRLGMNNQGGYIQNFSELENEVSASPQNVPNGIPAPPEYPDALFTYIETLIKEQRFEEAQKVHRQFLNFVKRALHSYVNRMMHLSHHYKNRAELPSEVIAYLDQNLILWFRDILNLLREETLHVLLHSAELSALAGKKEETDEFLLQFFFTADLRCGLTEKTQSDIAEVLAIGEQDIEVRLDALIDKLSAFVSQKANDAVSYIKEGGIQRSMGLQQLLYRLLNELLTTLDIKSPSLENITNLDDFESKVNKLMVTCRNLKQIQPGCNFPLGGLDSLQKTLSKLAAVENGKSQMKHRFSRLTVAVCRLFLDLSNEDDPYLEVRQFLNRYNITRTLSYDDVVFEENGGAAFYENEIEELYWLGNQIYERQAFPPKWKDYFISSLAIVTQEFGVIKMERGEASDTLFLRALELFESIPLFDEQDRPQNPEYHGTIIPHIAYCYYYLNNRDQALKWWFKITEIDEDRAVTRSRAWEARQAIGDIYYEKGLDKRRNGVESYTDDLKKAEEWYLKAEALQQTGRPRYARLGDLYAMQHRFEEAITIYESFLAMESEYPPSHKYLFDCYRFRRGCCLASMQRTEEAIEAFKKIVEIYQPEYQLYLSLAYQWLTGLYKKASRWQEYTEAREKWRECVEEAQAEGLPIAEEIVWDIVAECEKIESLIEDREFAWAEREIERCLKQYPKDPRLHVDKAKALRHQNKIDEAFESLNNAYYLDDRLRNHAIVFLEMGRCYIHSQKFDQAAEHFLKAYSLGSLDAIEGFTKKLAGALTLAAGALRNAGRHDEAIQLCKQVLEQRPNDAHALTCLARVYRLSGGEDDAERAIEILQPLIKSPHRDQRPVSPVTDLCYWAKEETTTAWMALQTITQLLWEGGIEVRETLLNRCQAFDLYDKSIISCIFECLKQYDLRFFRTAGDYLMKVTIHDYFHAPTREAFLNTLRTVLDGLLNSASPRIALVEYFASSKGAYTECIHEQIAAHASATLTPLSTPEKNEGRDLEEITRQSVLPEWMRLLRSHCRSAITAHFSGHDAPYDFIPELEELKNSFSAASQFLDVVWGGISRAEDKSYLMSGFLFRRFRDFLYELFSENGLEEHLQLAVNKEVAFQIEEHEGELLLKIRYRFSEPEDETPLPPLEKRRMDFEALERWLPSEIEIATDTGKLMLTIPFPAVRSAGESLGVWQSFFDYVVVETQDETGLGDYYKQAARRFPQTAVQRDVVALLDYAIAQMDAMFVAALDGASDRLRNPLHPIKNNLLHISDPERAEMVPVEVWRKQLENWRRIPYLLFQTMQPRFRRINIETFLESNLRSFETIYPHVSFEWAARETDRPIPLVEGCEPLLQQAVADIVHNAVDAINAMSEVEADFQPRVLFHLAAEPDGAAVDILNNGSRDEIRKAMSAGLGWKNVRWVVERIHHGLAARDSVDEGGFRYRVSLYLPFEIDKED